MKDRSKLCKGITPESMTGMGVFEDEDLMGSFRAFARGINCAKYWRTYAQPPTFLKKCTEPMLNRGLAVKFVRTQIPGKK